MLAADAPGQEVLEPSACLVNEERVEVRFVAGLPARGRRILDHQAVEMLCEDLPASVAQTLPYAAQDREALTRHVEQLVDESQVRAIGLALVYALDHYIRRPAHRGPDPGRSGG